MKAKVVANTSESIKVLVLSPPIEGISREEHAAGIGYIDKKMKQNVANLKEDGLECR